MDRIAPTLRPDGKPAGHQRWQRLLFLHWPVPIDHMRALLPDSLEVDDYEGRAWVGVVPFTMRDVRPRFAPAVPGVSNFHELNVRTYVHEKGRPGVFFFSLDAAATIAVLAARIGWSLPYFRASMEMVERDSVTTYTSERWMAGKNRAVLSCEYIVGQALGTATAGTFEHFLVERYLLFVERGDRLRVGQVHHRPYPLRSVEVRALEQSVTQAAGIRGCEGEPHARSSDGVDVDVFALEEA